MPSVQTPPAVESGELPALLDEAHWAPQLRPAPVRLADLDRQLRAEADRLVPLVQAQADRINRGTRAWYSRDRALAEARAALTTESSTSTLGACIRLSQLARVVRALDEYAGGEA